MHSLGVVLFQLLTDRLPYKVEGVMVHEALRAIREDQPALLSSIDRRLRTACFSNAYGLYKKCGIISFGVR